MLFRKGPTYLCLPTKGRGYIDFGACFGVGFGVVGVTVGYAIVGGFLPNLH